MSNTTSKLSVAELQTLLAKAEKKYTAARNARDRAANAVNQLHRDIHAATIRGMVGELVRNRGRGCPSKLDNAIGKLVKCRRTRCDVDFGEFGIWDMSIDEVTGVGQERDIALGGSA